MPTLSAIAEVGDVSIAFCRGARWRPCASWLARTAEPPLVDWLLDRSSLTARLRSVCPGGFAVRPLAQGYAPVRLNERHRLTIVLVSWRRKGRGGLAGTQTQCSVLALFLEVERRADG